MLKLLSSHLDKGSLFVVHKLIDTIVVSFVPVSSFEGLVLVSNIIELFANLIQSLVGNMDTIFGLNNALIKDSADILPLFDEPLS